MEQGKGVRRKLKLLMDLVALEQMEKGIKQAFRGTREAAMDRQVLWFLLVLLGFIGFMVLLVFALTLTLLFSCSSSAFTLLLDCSLCLPCSYCSYSDLALICHYLDITLLLSCFDPAFT